MKRAKIIEWVETLEIEQLKRVSVNLVQRLIETDDVHFPADADRPYWESCGESLDGLPVKWEE